MKLLTERLGWPSRARSGLIGIAAFAHAANRSSWPIEESRCSAATKAAIRCERSEDQGADDRVTDFPDPRRCSMIHCAACSINSSHAPRRGTSSRKRPPTPARTAPIVSGRSWRAPDGPDILDLFPVRCDRGIPSFFAPASGKKRHAGRLRIRSQLPLRSGKRPARPLRGCTPLNLLSIAFFGLHGVID